MAHRVPPQGIVVYGRGVRHVSIISDEYPEIGVRIVAKKDEVVDERMVREAWPFTHTHPLR